MKDFFAFIKKILSFWTIYGGIAMSLLISWWAKFTKTTMEMWATFITLSITCIGLLTFFKEVVFKKRKKQVGDIVSIKTKQVSQIGKAIYPEESSKELGEAIIHSVKEGKKIMSKIGKFFKWLWGNKLTLTSIVSNLFVTAGAQYVMYSDLLKDYVFFQEHQLVFKIVVGVLCGLWLADNIFCAISKYGLENLKELDERAEQKKNETLEKLTPEQKATLKKYLKAFEEQKSDLTKQINDVGKEIEKFEKDIDDFELLRKYNVDYSSEENQNYQVAQQKVVELSNDLVMLKNKKANVEINMKKVKSCL